jgi:hypothetical protein
MRQPPPGAFRPTPNYREQRRSGLVCVRITTVGEDAQEVMVRNVSSRGFSATSLVPPARGAIVSVRLPDDTVLAGVVRWVEDTEFGIEFDRVRR